MDVYLITYDLKSVNKDYAELFSRIKELGEWQHPLDSVWLVRSVRNANSIYLSLREVMGEKDLAMVVKVELSDIQGWLPKSFWSWVNFNCRESVK
jgi:hypothetical protein